MRRYVWLMGLLTACDGNETTAPVAPETQEPVVQEPEVKASTFEEKVAEARGLSLSGQHAAALTAAEALLNEKPEDAALWRLVGREALAAGEAEALLGRLDPASPIGGQAAPHHTLRAELALALGKLPEALSAAQAAGDAALIAHAVRAGAAMEAPAEAPDAALTPEQAFIAQVTAEEPVDEETAAAAAKVTGWRADLVRAQMAAAAGDVAGALASLEAVAGSGEPAAVAASASMRAGLAMARGEGAPTLDQAIGWSTAATESAISEGDGKGLSAALSSLAALYSAKLAPGEGLEAIGAFHQSVVETYGGEAGSLSGLVLARVNLSAGYPAKAHQLASEARTQMTDRPEAADAAWIEGWAAWQLGRADATSAAAEAAEGARQQALQALVDPAVGFPTTGLSDRDAVYVGVEAAQHDAGAAIEHLNRAIEAADATGDPMLRTYSRLAYETAARRAGREDAAEVRAALLSIFPRTPEGLTAEVAVRAALDGGSEAVTGEAPILKVWAALASGTPAAADVAGSGVAPLASWAKGRAGGGASAYNEALGGLPTHRQGGLSLNTALDGSQGVGVHADLSRLGEEATDIDAAMSCHELGHRIDAMVDDVSFGRDLTIGVPEAEREALLAAVARARAEMLFFQLGAPWPEEALAAVEAAEAKAAETSVPFKRLMPTPGTSVATLRETQSGTIFLSYLNVNGTLHGIAVHPEGGTHKYLGQTSRFYELADAHSASLAASAMEDGYADHSSGDKLRAGLIDVFAQELTGYGRYQVLAPTPLLQFSFTTFPEQASGLRWLADIRTIAQMPSIQTLKLPDVPVELYTPDFVGMGTPQEPEPAPKEEPSGEEEGGATVVAVENPDKPKLEVPVDLGLASRHFGSDFRVMLLGEDATHERYTEYAVSARYIYFADIPPSADGGFEIVGDALTLSEIRATPIPGKVVFLATPAETTVQVARARAFLDAGAESVVVMNWEIPESSMRRFVDGFYEALNRDRPTARALGDARSALLRDAMQGEEARDPGLWGSLVFYGEP